MPTEYDSKLKSEFIQAISQQQSACPGPKLADNDGSLHHTPFTKGIIKASTLSCFEPEQVDAILRLQIASSNFTFKNVGIFPVFCLEKMQRIATNLIGSKIKNPLLLKTYLEAITESNSRFLGNSKNKTLFFNDCQQWIIPLFDKTQMHHSSIIVNRVSTHPPKVKIQHYDSLGKPLNLNLKKQVCGFFNSLGFAIEYKQYLSKAEQLDLYNSGIFVCLKTVDIINENIGQPGLFLKDLQEENYWLRMDKYRCSMLKKLESIGQKIFPSESLKAMLKYYTKKKDSDDSDPQDNCLKPKTKKENSLLFSRQIFMLDWKNLIVSLGGYCAAFYFVFPTFLPLIVLGATFILSFALLNYFLNQPEKKELKTNNEPISLGLKEEGNENSSPRLLLRNYLAQKKNVGAAQMPSPTKTSARPTASTY